MLTFFFLSCRTVLMYVLFCRESVGFNFILFCSPHFVALSAQNRVHYQNVSLFKSYFLVLNFFFPSFWFLSMITYMAT